MLLARALAVLLALGARGAPAAGDARKPVPPVLDPKAPLSEEDRALLAELDVLERLELLRNPELFEPDDDAPDAGTPR